MTSLYLRDSSSDVMLSPDPILELPAPYTPPDCCTSIFKAIRAGHMGCIVRYPSSKLLEVDGKGISALHVSVKYGNYEVVDYILKETPVLLDYQCQTQETPLLIAAAYGHFQLVNKFLQGSTQEVLRRATHKDLNGTSALLAALVKSDNQIALYLLRRFGKNLALLSNNMNMLPIHVAAAQGNLEFLKIVTKFDQNMVNQKDSYGCTPCVYAVQSGCLACLRYLIEKAKADIGCLTLKGQTLFHVAALSGQFNVCRWLLQQMGTSAVLWQTLDSANTIHCAAFNGHVPILRLLLEPWSKKKQRLILTQRDSRGNTPLHLAVINANFGAAQCLLNFGANLALQNLNKQTPMDIGRMKGNQKLIRLIEQYNNISGKKGKTKKSQSCADLAVKAMIVGDNESSGYGSSETKKHGLKKVGSFLYNMNIQRVHESGTQTETENYWDEALAAVSELDRVLAKY